MSEFHVEVVRVGQVEKHPNADTLGITKVYDYPVIVRLGEFQPGDLAVYIPVDAMLPTSDPRFSFLGSRPMERVKAKRLRGIFSMGLLTPAPAGCVVGQDVAALLGVQKWEPGENTGPGVEIPGPPGAPRYTDIEGLRKHGRVIEPGEPVVVTEKIHGANARYMHDGEQFWVGSHTKWKDPSGDCIWAKAAQAEGLADKLAKIPGIMLFGEVFGQVQDLKYGHDKGGCSLRFFDAFDTRKMAYLDWAEVVQICDRLDLRTVPVLYLGPWDLTRAEEWAEGKSTLANHVREGFVVKPLVERYDHRVGRVILKRHGEGYLTRKGG